MKARRNSRQCVQRPNEFSSPVPSHPRTNPEFEYFMREIRVRMRCRRGGKPDLDPVEVVQRLSPRGNFVRRIASVALVRDDDIEGVDRNIEAIGTVLDKFFPEAKYRLAPEHVHGDPLDGRNEHERIPGLRIGQITLRHDFGVEFFRIPEILGLKVRRVHFVDLVELLPRFRIEGSTDLLTWVTLGHVTALDGACHFVDDASQDQRSKFYRAVPITEAEDPSVP